MTFRVLLSEFIYQTRVTRTFVTLVTVLLSLNLLRLEILNISTFEPSSHAVKP